MKTIGILGGMGPKATHYFYGKLLEKTPARSDSEHIPTLIYSNTQIPDRTPAMNSDKAGDVEKALAHTAKVLEQGGADFIVMPCNTVHFFASAVTAAVSIPFLNIIDETALFLKDKPIKKIGILGTTGTIESKLYDHAFECVGIPCCSPDSDVQERVMSLIFQIKSGEDFAPMYLEVDKAIQHLQEKGADTFLLGCTELPLLFNNGLPQNYYDPMDILASVAVRTALNG